MSLPDTTLPQTPSSALDKDNNEEDVTDDNEEEFSDDDSESDFTDSDDDDDDFANEDGEEEAINADAVGTVVQEEINKPNQATAATASLPVEEPPTTILLPAPPPKEKSTALVVVGSSLAAKPTTQPTTNEDNKEEENEPKKTVTFAETTEVRVIECVGNSADGADPKCTEAVHTETLGNNDQLKEETATVVQELTKDEESVTKPTESTSEVKPLDENETNQKIVEELLQDANLLLTPEQQDESTIVEEEQQQETQVADSKIENSELVVATEPETVQTTTAVSDDSQQTTETIDFSVVLLEMIQDKFNNESFRSTQNDLFRHCLSQMCLEAEKVGVFGHGQEQRAKLEDFLNRYRRAHDHYVYMFTPVRLKVDPESANKCVEDVPYNLCMSPEMIRLCSEMSIMLAKALMRFKQLVFTIEKDAPLHLLTIDNTQQHKSSDDAIAAASDYLQANNIKIFWYLDLLLFYLVFELKKVPFTDEFRNEFNRINQRMIKKCQDRFLYFYLPPNAEAVLALMSAPAMYSVLIESDALIFQN